MGAVLGEEAVRVQTDTVRLTTTLLRQLIRATVQSYQQHGEMKLKMLNAQGRQLESVELPGEDMQRLRRQLKRYQVDFSVLRDRETGKYEVFFKSQDAERVYKGLEQVVADWDRNTERKPAKEIFAAAKKEAARRQAERSAEREAVRPTPDRSVR